MSAHNRQQSTQPKGVLTYTVLQNERRPSGSGRVAWPTVALRRSVAPPCRRLRLGHATHRIIIPVWAAGYSHILDVSGGSGYENPAETLECPVCNDHIHWCQPPPGADSCRPRKIVRGRSLPILPVAATCRPSRILVVFRHSMGDDDTCPRPPSADLGMVHPARPEDVPDHEGKQPCSTWK